MSPPLPRRTAFQPGLPPRPVRPVLAALAALAALTLGACATTPPPTTQLAVSRAAVDRASGPAAAEAPAELALAREKISRATRALADKDHATARRLAEEAEADAALAEARARELRSETALNEVRESLRQLRAAIPPQ